MNASAPPRLAVLIDADNASPRIARGLLQEIAAIGEASVRRIYGDFSGTRLKGWTDVLAVHALVPHQNFANTAGKNASDIALVIDAMDLLHSGRFGGFCIVSSDGDFTRLAARIREQGLDVFGFGERKTPQSFVQACKRFIYTENLGEELPAAPGASTATVAARSGTSPARAIPLIRQAMEQLDADCDGWMHLGAVGSRLLSCHPDSDPRSYGHAKLSDLVRQCGAFEIETRNGKVVYVRPPDARLAG